MADPTRVPYPWEENDQTKAQLEPTTQSATSRVKYPWETGRQVAPQTQPAEEKSDFTEGVQAGWNELQAIGGGAVALGGGLAKKLGFEDFGQGLEAWGMETFEKNMEEARQFLPNEGAGTFMEAKDDAGSLIDWAQYNLGKLVPMMATSMLGGGLGGLAARGLVGAGLKDAAKKVLSEKILDAAGRKTLEDYAKRVALGQTAGVAASSVGMEAGSIYGDIKQETGESAPGTALLYGVPAGLLDAIVPGRIAKALNVGRVPKAVKTVLTEAEQAAAKKAPGKVRQVLGEAGKSALMEGLTEPTQGILERAALEDVKGTLGTAEGMDRILDPTQIIEEAAVGALGGGVFGGGAKALQRKGPQVADRIEELKQATIKAEEEKKAAEAAKAKETADKAEAEKQARLKLNQENIEKGPTKLEMPEGTFTKSQAQAQELQKQKAAQAKAQEKQRKLLDKQAKELRKAKQEKVETERLGRLEVVNQQEESVRTQLAEAQAAWKQEDTPENRDRVQKLAEALGELASLRKDLQKVEAPAAVRGQKVGRTLPEGWTIEQANQLEIDRMTLGDQTSTKHGREVLPKGAVVPPASPEQAGVSLSETPETERTAQQNLNFVGMWDKLGRKDREALLGKAKLSKGLAAKNFSEMLPEERQTVLRDTPQHVGEGVLRPVETAQGMEVKELTGAETGEMRKKGKKDEEARKVYNEVLDGIAAAGEQVQGADLPEQAGPPDIEEITGGPVKTPEQMAAQHARSISAGLRSKRAQEGRRALLLVGDAERLAQEKEDTKYPFGRQNRLDPDTQEAVERVAKELKWDQEGGHILRDQAGNVNDRTTWIAKVEEWLPENRPEDIRKVRNLPKRIAGAIQKVKDKKALTPVEERIVQWTEQIVYDRQQDVGGPKRFTPEIRQMAQELDGLRDGAGSTILEKYALAEQDNATTHETLADLLEKARPLGEQGPGGQVEAFLPEEQGAGKGPQVLPKAGKRTVMGRRVQGAELPLQPEEKEGAQEVRSDQGPVPEGWGIVPELQDEGGENIQQPKAGGRPVPARRKKEGLSRQDLKFLKDQGIQVTGRITKEEQVGMPQIEAQQIEGQEVEDITIDDVQPALKEEGKQTEKGKEEVRLERDDPARVRAELAKEIGEIWVKRAEDAGVLHILTRKEWAEAGLPETAVGGWGNDSKKLFVRGDVKDAVSVLFHEAEHANMRGVLHRSYGRLQKQFEGLVKKGDKVALESEQYGKDVRKWYEDRHPGTPERRLYEVYQNERLARYIEKSRGGGLARTLRGELAAWFRQTALGQALANVGIAPSLTPQLASSLAARAMRSEVRAREYLAKARQEVEEEMATRKARQEVRDVNVDRLGDAVMPTLVDQEGNVYKTRLDINKKRGIKVMGPQFYGEMSDGGVIALKEMFQNAFDAVRTALDEGKMKDGTIDIKVDPVARTIEISDNGLGMDIGVASKAFMNMFETGKEDVGTGDTSGSLGVAKAVFLIGNAGIEVDTVQNGQRLSLRSDGKTIQDSLIDPGDKETATVDWTGSPAPGEPNGTRIKIIVPETFHDRMEDRIKPVTMPNTYAGGVDALVNSPLFDDRIAVRYNGTLVPIGKNWQKDDYVPVTEIKFPWGQAVLYAGKNEKTMYYDSKNVQVLINGLWQFGLRHEAQSGNRKKVIPREFYIDMRTSLKGSDAGYPMAMNRKGWSAATQAGFDRLLEYLSLMYRNTKVAETVASYGAMHFVEADGTIGAAQQLTPKLETKHLEGKTFTFDAKDTYSVDANGRVTKNGRELPKLEAKEMESQTFDVSQFRIPQSEVAKGKTLLHNNYMVQTENEPTTKLIQQLAKQEITRLEKEYKKLMVDKEKVRAQEGILYEWTDVHDERHPEWKNYLERLEALSDQEEQLRLKANAANRDWMATKVALKEFSGKEFAEDVEAWNWESAIQRAAKRIEDRIDKAWDDYDQIPREDYRKRQELGNEIDNLNNAQSRILEFDDLMTNRLDNAEVKLVPATEFMQKKFGKKWGQFVQGLGEQFKKVTDFVIQLDSKYERAREVPVGVSLGEYGGVHVYAPFEAMFVNPAEWYVDRGNFELHGKHLATVMVHEIVHTVEANHRPTGFIHAEEKLWTQLNDYQGGQPAQQLFHELGMFMLRNKEIATVLEETIHGIGTKTIGIKLKDSGEYNAPRTGADRPESGQRGERGRNAGVRGDNATRSAKAGERRGPGRKFVDEVMPSLMIEYARSQDGFRRWSQGLEVVEEGEWTGGPAIFIMYHGTTHNDIEAFRKEGSLESAIGQGPYFTTASEDASANYAGFGPDLQGRIDREMDQFAQEGWEWDEEPADVATREWEEQGYGEEEIAEMLQDESQVDQALFEAARRQVAETLSGEARLGLMMPVFVRLARPFDLSDVETEWQGRRNELGKGRKLPILNALQEVGEEWDLSPDDITEIREKLLDGFADGATTGEVWEALLQAPAYYKDDEWTTSAQFAQEVIARTGLWDGLVQNAGKAFGPRNQRGFMGRPAASMEGVGWDTLHVVPFEDALKGGAVKSTMNPSRWGNNPDVLGSFVGQKAQGANLRSLEEAQVLWDSMEQMGWSRERKQRKVLNRTGWFRGDDDKWRWEISDKDASLEQRYWDMFKEGVQQGRIGQSFMLPLQIIFKHPKLFRAYPQLNQVLVKTQLLQHDSGASFMVQENGNPLIELYLGPESQPHKVREYLLHEIQHGIQNLEGFARGGSDTNPWVTSLAMELTLDAREELHKQSAKYLRQMRQVTAAIEGKLNAWMQSEEGKKIRHVSMRAQAFWMSNPGLKAIYAKEQQEYVKKVEKLKRDLKLATKPGQNSGELFIDPYYVYWQLAGEIEARNTERRSLMDGVTRLQRPPWETRDVPRMSAIIRWNGQDRPEFPQPDASGERTFGVDFMPSLVLDPNYVSDFEESNRMIREDDKTLWDKARKVVTRWVRPGGLLRTFAPGAFEELMRRNANLNTWDSNAERLVKTLEQAATNAFGTSWRKMDQGTLDLMDMALRGNQVALKKLPENVQEAITSMRYYVDNFSQEYAQILWQDSQSLEEDIAEAPTEGKKRAMEDSLDAKIGLYNTILKNVGEYVHRSYKVFDNKEYYRNVPSQVLDEARTYFVERLKEENLATKAAADKKRAKDPGVAEVEVLTQEQLVHEANRVMEKILKDQTAYESFEQWIRQTPLGKKDLTILMKRDEIPEPVLNLMGVNSDPRLNFAKTAAKIVRLVSNHRFLERLVQVGTEQGWLFKKGRRDGSVPVAASQTIRGGRGYDPLQGYETFPEVAQGLVDAVDQMKWPEFFEQVVKFTSWTKYQKTILSPAPTGIRNYLSSAMALVANGDLNWDGLVEGVGAFREYVLNKDLGKLHKRLQHVGIVGVSMDTPFAGEMMDLRKETGLDDAIWQEQAQKRKNLKSMAHAFWRLTHDGRRFMERGYQFGDDLIKIAAFKGLTRTLDKYVGARTREKYAGAFDATDWIENDRVGKVKLEQTRQGGWAFVDNYGNNITEEGQTWKSREEAAKQAGEVVGLWHIEHEAAERIRNTYMTYSLVGRLPKFLRKFPLTGTFVSFPVEVLRTVANMVKYAREDLKDPDLRPMAIKRLVGMGLTATLPYLLTEYMKGMWDVDDDEIEAARQTVPEWNKLSNLVPIGRAADGKLELVDFGYVDLYSAWRLLPNALINDDPLEEDLWNVAKEFVEPFFGLDITAKAAYEVLVNEKVDGGPIWNPEDFPEVQAQAMVGHLLKSVSSSTLLQSEKIFRAMDGHTTRSGETLETSRELAALGGWKTIKADASRALWYGNYGFEMKRKNATSLLSRMIGDPNPVSEEELRNTFDRAKEARHNAYKELLGKVEAARKLGMSNLQLRIELTKLGVAKRDLSAVLRGRVPRWTADSRVFMTPERKADVLYSAEQKAAISKRRREVLQLIRKEGKAEKLE